MEGNHLGLACGPANRPAIQLYEGLGFVRVGLDVVDEWNWLDVRGEEHHQSDRCTYWMQTLSHR